MKPNTGKTNIPNLGKPIPANLPTPLYKEPHYTLTLKGVSGFLRERAPGGVMKILDREPPPGRLKLPGNLNYFCLEVFWVLV